MKPRRLTVSAIGLLLLALVGAWLTGTTTADAPRAAQVTATPTPASPPAGPRATVLDRQRVAYVDMAANAMWHVLDALQYGAGRVVLGAVGTPAVGPTTPTTTPLSGAATAPVTPAATPTPGGTLAPSAGISTPVGTTGAAATVASTALPTTAATGMATVVATSAPTIAATPPATGVATGVAGVTTTIVPTLAATTQPTTATTGMPTAAATSASPTGRPPAGGTPLPPPGALPLLVVDRPLEMIDFIPHMRAMLHTSAQGLEDLDSLAANLGAGALTPTTCANLLPNVRAADTALRDFQLALRTASPGAATIDPPTVRALLDASARLQATRTCLVNQFGPLMGTTESASPVTSPTAAPSPPTPSATAATPAATTAATVTTATAAPTGGVPAPIGTAVPAATSAATQGAPTAAVTASATGAATRPVAPTAAGAAPTGTVTASAPAAPGGDDLQSRIQRVLDDLSRRLQGIFGASPPASPTPRP